MSIIIQRLCDVPEWIETCNYWDLSAWPRTPENEVFFTLHYDQASRHHTLLLPQTWVAVQDNKPVGMISLMAEDHPDFIDKGPWLAAAFILPEYRGQGLFTKLHDHVVAFARDALNASSLFVHSYLDFTRWGWVHVTEADDPFGQYEMVTIYEKKLKQPTTSM